MKPELKHKWIKALRSGEYKKSTNVLKRFFKTVEPRHCCMGVLCELMKDDYAPAGVLIKQAEGVGDFYGCNKSIAAVLDMQTLQEAGVSADHQRTLTSMNDKGVSWDRISAYIEKRL